MKKTIGLIGLGIFATLAVAQSFAPQAIEHTLSVVQRPDGRFDVRCLDGVVEIRARAEVLGNQICTHLKTFSGRWTLSEGGIDNGTRLCDLNMNMIRSDYSILKLRAGFAAPCVGTDLETQQCNGLNCALELGGKFFDFDFTTTGQVRLTRMEDGLTAIYRGNAGNGSGSLGTARLSSVNGTPNILQNTVDNGVTWRSVCDDSFDQRAAQVACRELGYSGVTSLATSVYVSGDTQFGWDDVICTGTELALSECRHTAWGVENCDQGEHVQLVCAP